MTQKAKLIIINDNKEKNLENIGLTNDLKSSNRKKIYIDDFIHLDYKSAIIVDSNVSQSSKSDSFNSIKVISIVIIISSLIQTILYIFIFPNNLNWSNKIFQFLIVFGWIILFNFIIFMPSVLKIIANYLNKALTAYECR